MQSLFDARRELLTVSPAAYAVNATLISYPPDWLQKNMQVVAASRANAPASAEARAIVEQRIEALLAFDGTEQASQLQLPIQVFSARDDLVIPSFMQDELVAALPQASLVNFRQGGHFFPVSRHDAFVRKVRSWIKKL